MHTGDIILTNLCPSSTVDAAAVALQLKEDAAHPIASRKAIAIFPCIYNFVPVRLVPIITHFYRYQSNYK